MLKILYFSCCVCYSGADELLTILSYVVIQTQHPDLIVESSAVMDFAREKFVIFVVLDCRHSE